MLSKPQSHINLIKFFWRTKKIQLRMSRNNSDFLYPGLRWVDIDWKLGASGDICSQRNQIKSWLKAQQKSVNGKSVKSNYDSSKTCNRRRRNSEKGHGGVSYWYHHETIPLKKNSREKRSCLVLILAQSQEDPICIAETINLLMNPHEFNECYRMIDMSMFLKRRK